MPQATTKQRKVQKEDLIKYLEIDRNIALYQTYDVITVSDASFSEDECGCHMGYAILLAIKDTIEIPGERPYKGYHMFYSSGYRKDAADSAIAEQMALVKAARETALLLDHHLNKDKYFTPRVLMLTDYMSFAGSVFRGMQSWPSPHKDNGFGACTREWIGRILRRCYVTVKHITRNQCKALNLIDKCSKRIRRAGVTGEVVKDPELVKCG